MGRGSLGEVLPDPVKALFVLAMVAQAASPHDDHVVTWTGPSGHAHQLAVPGAPAEPRAFAVKGTAPAFVDDFVPIVE
jgi:hypothetical protein